MISIDELQSAQYTWARKNFGPCRSRWPLLGVFEETGELLHSQLKHEQKIRGPEGEEDPTKIAAFHDAKKKDAVADITIYLFEYCSCMGWKVVDLLVEEEATLHELQAHVEDSESVWDCIAKIVPLAYDENMSGDNVLAQEDAVQILLNLAIYCRKRGWSYQELVETVWLRVSQRDWTKNKANGGDTIDGDDKKLGEYLAFLKSDKGKAALRRSITAEIDKWKDDPNYIPILPGPVPFERHQVGVMGSPGPLSPDCEIFILSSDDPHSPSALYGYSESLRNGYDSLGIASDDKHADEIWTKADQWGERQSQLPRTALRVVPRAGLRREKTLLFNPPPDKMYPGLCALCLPGGNMNCGHTMKDVSAGMVDPPNTFLTPNGEPPKDWEKIPKPE